MILESIISALNAALLPSNYFEQLFCLAELIKGSDDKSRPMIYSGNGQYSQVNNFDNYNGMGYWRKSGDVSSAIDNSTSMRACDDQIRYRYPLKFVCAIPRAKFVKDDQYTDDRVTDKLIATLAAQNSAIKATIGAKLVSILPQKYTTDNKSIVAAEYSGLWSDINYKFSYLSIDFEIEVLISKSCIPDQC